MSESSDAPCGHTDIFLESKLHPLTISIQNTSAEPFLYGLFSYTHSLERCSHPFKLILVRGSSHSHLRKWL